MKGVSRLVAPVGTPALMVSEILLTAACFLVLTFLILNVDPTVFLFADNGLLRIGLACASILFGLYFEDLYTNLKVKSHVLLIQQLSLVMGIALLAQGLLGYAHDGFRLPLRLMVPACAALVLLLYGWRIAYSALVLRVMGAQRILFVGMCPLLLDIADHIGQHPEVGMQVIGFVEDPPAPAAPPAAGPWLGPVSSLAKAAAEGAADRVVVGMAELRGRMPIPDLLQLRYGGMPIDEASTAYEQLSGRVLLDEMRPANMLFAGAFRPPAQRLIYQTIGHWMLAFVLSILTLPLLLLAMALLKFSSHGPLLDRQECVGLGGRPFKRYSFRLAGEGGKLNGAQRFVVRWRLYALPQLWNILRGDMVFIGPRAERTEFAQVLSDRIPLYRQRYGVKPGVTGWAQINLPPGQSDDTMRRLEFDFYYLKNFSHGLDAYILVHTVRELLVSGA